MNKQRLSITELFEKLEDAYKKYGDISVAIKLSDNIITLVHQIGIAEAPTTNPNETKSNSFYFCVSPDLSVNEQESAGKS